MECLSEGEVKDALLGILISFDSVCREHGIKYSLDSGTLLGAVRHKGFIPWDDDIDVIVPRPDYEKLLAHPEWMSTPYSVCDPSDPKHPWPFAKYVDTRFNAQESHLVNSVVEKLWIDIFPADAVPDDPGKAEKYALEQKRLCAIASLTFVGLENQTDTGAKLLAKRLLWPFCKLFAPCDRVFKRIGSNAASRPYGSTGHVANMVCVSVCHGRQIPISDFDNLTTLEFEGHRFNAIPHWDEYLSGLYGDYMKLPPVDKRVNHGSKVWRAEGDR